MIERLTLPWPGHSTSRPPAEPLHPAGPVYPPHRVPPCGGRFTRTAPRDSAAGRSSLRPPRSSRRTSRPGRAHKSRRAQPRRSFAFISRAAPAVSTACARARSCVPFPVPGQAVAWPRAVPPPPHPAGFIRTSFRLASSQGGSPPRLFNLAERGRHGAAAEHRSHSDHCPALRAAWARACCSALA